MMNGHISCGGTDLSKKPKYMENFWKNIIFIYACLILSLTLSLSVNEMNGEMDNNLTNNTRNTLHNTTSIVLDVFLTLLYIVASSILIAISVYLHINRNQTYEEAKKENSKSSEIHYSMCGEKVGLYLRFGVVLIGSLALIHIALSNIRTKTYKSGCLNLSSIFSGITECLFFIIQTAFILKYHSVVILKNTRLIQFGLYNIIFINITIWEISSITKIKFSSSIAKMVKNDCTDKSFETLHLYFLPAVSEYCVICMAIIYEIMKRLGKLSLIETFHAESPKNMFWKRQTSLLGVIIGVLIALICMGFTATVITLDMAEQKIVFIIHNTEEIVLYIFAIIILLLAFSATNQLKYSFTYLSNNVDKNLLYVSCFLSITFSILVSTFCFQYTLIDTQMLVRAISSLLEIFQIIIQTYVIQDAFYRCSDSIIQQQTKPGQGYLGVAIGINFGLWLFKSFQLKNGDYFFHKVSPVTKLPNAILLNFFVYLTLPLSILYRYHSSSCLADIFSKVYQGEACRFEGLLRAEGFEKCVMVDQEQSESNFPKILVLNGSPKLGRPRAITLPILPQFGASNPKSLSNKKMARRETIKNLETAKLRVLSSHFSHSMVSKKLSATVAPSLNVSTITLNENENEKSAKYNPKFQDDKEHHAHSDSDMSTIKQLVVSNIFNSSMKRRKSRDDLLIAKSVKFSPNPINEQKDDEE